MKFVGLIGVCFMVFGCNLAKWNQKRLTKRFDRKSIVEGHFKNDQHNVHYYEGGEGETVLLIHGFGGDAQVTWDRSIRDLAKDYHVIAPDLLWFGKSTSSATPSLNAQVDALFTLLEDRGVEKCSIAGISYGGFVTLGMVYKNKDFFTKVCIVDSPGVTYDMSLLDELSKKQGEERFQDIFVVKSREDVQELFELAFYKSKHVPNGILQDAYDLYFDDNHQQLDQLLTSLTQEQKMFAQVDIEGFPPSLVIWGEFDEVFPPSEGRKLADFMEADYLEVPRSGHAPNLENFKVFQFYLRDFLAN
jgi:pimeloyl-ACP methyl ester carboxylesterase